MALQSEDCLWNQWNFLHNKGFFNSDRVTISCYVQSPNEVVNRNSVVRMNWSIESGNLDKDELKTENLQVAYA